MPKWRAVFSGKHLKTRGGNFQTSNGSAYTHIFHANAFVLRSDSNHPLVSQLGEKAAIRLPDEGGFRSQFVEGYQSGDGISFQSAYMHVAGTRSSKPGYGWATLATSVLVGFNLRDAVMADFIFSQVSTEHPLEGEVPAVSFVGTRFENLRIGGREVEPVFDLNIVGPKPANDRPYVHDAGFLNRVSQQYERMGTVAGLSDSARAQYHGDLAKTQQQGKVECSLVTSVPQALPGTSYGHVVELAGIGRVSLAKLTVGKAFHLTMVSLDSSGGTISGAGTTANGHGGPPNPTPTPGSGSGTP